MTEQTPTTNGHPLRTHVEGDTIDFGQLAHAIWRRKAIIVALTVSGALLGFGASVLGTQYVSEGLLLMPRVSVAEYKRYEVALANEPRVEGFLKLRDRGGDHVADLLRETIHDPSRLAEAVRPEFSFTDRDAKQFGIKVDEPGALVGARLKLQQREKTTEAPVLLLAEYVRDTVIKVDMESNILMWCLEYQTREQELRNDQLDSEFYIKQQQIKVSNLRDIIARIPSAATIDGRQVVSLEHGGERFLSPVAQLVGSEIVIADLEIEQVKRDRERVAAGLKKEYYCQARAMLETPISARAFLTGLKQLHAELFAGQDMTVNILEQTSNALDLQRTKWNNNYLSQMRFVASPDGAQVRVRKPGRVIGVVVGTFLGLLAGVALAIFLSWWRRNRDVIVSDDE